MNSTEPATNHQQPSFSLLEGGLIVGEETKGDQALLIVEGRIAAVGGDANRIAAALPRDSLKKLRLDELILAPGLVDAHVHFLGGGGFAGYNSRSPQLGLSDFTLNGITTAVGAPGTDMISRSMEGLLAKAYALTDEGITAHIYTGGFHRPLQNLTGSVWRDAYLLPAVRGVKLAVGEPRAASHSRSELLDLARELYWVEGAIGRPVVIHVHLGLENDGHELLRSVLEDLPNPERLVVTHCNRSPQHLETATELVKARAWVDMTCMISPHRGFPDAIRPADAILRLLEKGASIETVTLSTDGNGSPPSPRPDGRWDRYVTHMDSLLDEVRALSDTDLGMGAALEFATLKPATTLGIQASKGQLRVGSDADIIAFAPGLRIHEVFARGRHMVSRGAPIVLGRYERKASYAGVRDSSKLDQGDPM